LGRGTVALKFSLAPELLGLLRVMPVRRLMSSNRTDRGRGQHRVENDHRWWKAWEAMGTVGAQWELKGSRLGEVPRGAGADTSRMVAIMEDLQNVKMRNC
jgi:hypothetical protein